MKNIRYCFLILFLFSSFGISQEKIKIPTSTIVVVKSLNKLSSAQITTGQHIILSVASDVIVKNKVVIKSGTPVISIVESAEDAGMVGQSGNLAISIQSTTAVDGTTIALIGNFFTKGESKIGESVAVSVLLCPLALLCKGGEGEIPVGAQARALTASEYEITLVNKSLSDSSIDLNEKNDVSTSNETETQFRSFFLSDLKSGNPQVLFGGKVSLTYESSGWGKSLLKAKGILGFSNSVYGPFEYMSIQVEQGKTLYMQIEGTTIYRINVVREIRNELTIEFTKM